ncbi:MAG: glycosyltransferase family 4 protein [Planctomycetota bacterium]|nr:glycosyltransferase family 4 protein [Planctomycetota bacterium]
MSDPSATRVQAGRRVPVVAAISDILSGVDSWVWRLAAGFAGHERYDFRVLVCNRAQPRIGAAGHAPSARQVAKFLDAAAPCVLLPNYAWPALRAVARRPAALPRISVIAYCHADSAEEYYHPLQWYEPIVDHFVAVSDACRSGVQQRIPSRADDVALLPYGVERGRPRDAPPAAAPLRVLYAGRLQQEQKRALDLVPLCARLHNRGVDIRLTIAGDGTERAALASGLARLAVNVNFLGTLPHDAMAELYRQQDVLVLVSDFEGTSNSLLEAMANGVVPVVTRTQSGVADVVRDRKNGCIVDIGDMEAMAAAIAELAGDRAQLRHMQASASKTAGTHSIEGNVATLTQIFDTALEQAPRTWPAGRSVHPELPVKEGVFVPRRLRQLRDFVRRRLDLG